MIIAKLELKIKHRDKKQRYKDIEELRERSKQEERGEMLNYERELKI